MPEKNRIKKMFKDISSEWLLHLLAADSDKSFNETLDNLLDICSIKKDGKKVKKICQHTCTS